MACSDPSQFRSLVAPYCTDLRSDTCTWALVEAGGAFGPGCLDLSIVAIPELGMPPYRAYACPGATGALARLCGPKQGATQRIQARDTSTGSSYGTLAAGLGVSTAVLGLTALRYKVTNMQLDEARSSHLDTIVDLSRDLHDLAVHVDPRVEPKLSAEGMYALSNRRPPVVET
jgi:hypothetical protein